MCDKMAISTYILKIVEKDPFLRLHMSAKEMFNRNYHNFHIFNHFYQYFAFTKKVLHRFVSFCISSTSTYCLLEENKLVTIKHFYSSHLKS